MTFGETSFTFVENTFTFGEDTFTFRETTFTLGETTSAAPWRIVTETFLVPLWPGGGGRNILKGLLLLGLFGLDG